MPRRCHEFCDALIVGGGPAGAACAWRLAQLGWHVVIVERGERHRSKACGHCLGPQAQPLLQRLGALEQTLQLARGRTAHLHVHDPTQCAVKLALTSNGDHRGINSAGLIVPRHEFDQMLLDRAAAAGAHVLQPAAARLEIILPTGATVHLQTRNGPMRVGTRLLIAADGVGSGLARASGLAGDAIIGRNYGFSFDLSAPALSHASDAEPWRGAINMFIANNGYLGIVHQDDDRWHIAAMVRTEPLAQAVNPVAFVHSIARQHDLLRRIELHHVTKNSLQRTCAIGPMFWRPRRLANAAVALIGDAAGYIEPFTGEGMTHALHSAELLAEVASSGQPGQWNAARAQQYQTLWNARIGRQQWICRCIGYALQRPRLRELAVELAQRWPGLAQRMTQQVVAA